MDWHQARSVMEYMRRVEDSDEVEIKVQESLPDPCPVKDLNDELKGLRAQGCRYIEVATERSWEDSVNLVIFGWRPVDDKELLEFMAAEATLKRHKELAEREQLRKLQEKYGPKPTRKQRLMDEEPF